MATTAIEWSDRVWNPTTGCDRVSPGCDHCYAMTMAKRLKGMGQAKYQRDGDPRTSGPGFGVSVHPDTLGDPLKWRKPERIFVNSMSDLFHDNVSDEFIARVWSIMAHCDQHTFMILTKRHARMRSLIGSEGFRESVFKSLAVEHPGEVMGDYWPLPNVWLGCSAENQQWADIRIPALLDTPAAVRFVSCEPLLGPVDLHAIPNGRRMDGGWGGGTCSDRERLHSVKRDGGIDWVITGGESGPGARPMHPDWARSLRDQCVTAGVPFLFKQWGEYRPAGRGDDVATMTCVQASTGVVVHHGQDTSGLAPGGWVAMRRVGKKAAGRELDGRTWDGFPAEVAR